MTRKKSVSEKHKHIDWLCFWNHVDDENYMVSGDVEMGVGEYSYDDDYYYHNIEVVQMQFCSEDGGCWDFDSIQELDSSDERRITLMRIYDALEQRLIEHVDTHIREYVFDDFEEYETIDYDTDIWYS